MAMGGTTNTVLHTLAIAHEAEIDYDLSRINQVAERVPYLSKIAPASAYTMQDVHDDGGIRAIIGELSERGAGESDRMTVARKRVG